MSTPAEVSQVFCNILLMRMGWAAPEVSSGEVEGLIEVLSLLFQDPLPGGLYTLHLAPQIMHTYLLSYLLRR